MFDVSPDHAIGLVAGLVAFPLALIVLRFHPAWLSATGTVRAACVLMVVTGAIHLSLIPVHLRSDPATSVLFLFNGVAFFILATQFTWRWWRLASAVLLVGTMLGYLIYVVAGLEGPDQVGLATKLVELVALGLVLIPVRGEAGRPRRTLRWTSFAIALPMLTVISGATLWVVDLARPDARHVHAGALLQATAPIATDAQRAAADQLYNQTRTAILPYEDWHMAYAAGYRPGGPSNMPSSHWMNQAYVKAGYVMDPKRPQGLVYANTKHGPVLLGAMFQMQHIGQFGPDPGGPITAWHQHENICFAPIGFEFSFMTPYGICPIGSIDISASPMLHVWIVDNPKGGQFAVDIDPAVVKAIDKG